LLDDFRSAEIDPDAKETCKNWIYKVSCIRELIPRIYVELAIVSAYRMIDGLSPSFDLPKVCARIVRTIRGIGDPVASIYARAYAVTQISRLRTAKHGVAFDGSTVQLAVDDTLQVLDRVLSNRLSTMIDHISVKVESKHEFIEVVSPAVSWILLNYVHKASESQLESFLEQYKSTSNHGLILFHILEVFPSSFVSLHASQFCDLVVEAKAEHFEIVSKIVQCLGLLSCDSINCTRLLGSV
jgi:hypothetical protein